MKQFNTINMNNCLKEYINIKESIDFLLTKTELSSNRFIEAEQELRKLVEMNNFKRFFARKRINKFLKNQIHKYNF